MMTPSHNSTQTQRISPDAKISSRQGFLVPVNRPNETPITLSEISTVGRDPSNTLVLKDTFASSRHARIELRKEGYFVRDLHSRNGTFLNSSKINEALLSHYDRLRFGESVFVFTESLPDVESLTSKNLAWNNELRRLPAFSLTDFPVLISGPSGSGKEILARAIHRHSGRSSGPFLSINCSALSEGLIESELFGHTRGSFTGATNDRKGAFESARGGTLFLDEIGDLPLSLQPKLLRALENNEIRPVGSDRNIETDVRIIAATHKSLPDQVQLGKFREDLFYRLNVCQLHPPALIERKEDFDDLLYQFAKLFKVRFTFNAIEKLKHHSWPGNIRELKNLVARASAYYPGKQITPDDLSELLEPLPRMEPIVNYIAEPTIKGNLVKEFEREMILRRLIANRGNQRRTARDLGMPKSTLNDRIRSYGLNIEEILNPMF